MRRRILPDLDERPLPVADYEPGQWIDSNAYTLEMTPTDLDPEECARCKLSLLELPDGSYRLYRWRADGPVCVHCQPLSLGEEATSNLRLASPLRGRAGTNIDSYAAVRSIDGVLRFDAE